jgi:hypothetical protein
MFYSCCNRSVISNDINFDSVHLSEDVNSSIDPEIYSDAADSEKGEEDEDFTASFVHDLNRSSIELKLDTSAEPFKKVVGRDSAKFEEDTNLETRANSPAHQPASPLHFVQPPRIEDASLCSSQPAEVRKAKAPPGKFSGIAWWQKICNFFEWIAQIFGGSPESRKFRLWP